MKYRYIASCVFTRDYPELSLRIQDYLKERFGMEIIRCCAEKYKVRQRRKWFSRKYYASVMNIKEFYEDNIGKSFTGIISNALNKNFGRNQ